jgi:hypothetical protein
MLISVKVMNGAEYSVEVNPEQTVLTLKTFIRDTYNIPVNQQRLLLKGKPLSGKFGSFAISFLFFPFSTHIPIK